MSDIQREANELDLEMFRLLDRIDRFLDKYPDKGLERLLASYSVLDLARRDVRKHMSKKDREATE